jgi:glycosyl transferase family 2/sulfotransferase family protein
VRLIMTLLVLDEADVIRQNVAFHLEQGVDFIVVTDHGSVDGTRDILEDLRRTHPMQVIDEPPGVVTSQQLVTRMALLARDDHGADWILNGDADEFWRASSGDLKSALVGAAADTDILLCARRHMLSPHNQNRDEPWFKTLVYRVSRPVTVPELRDRLTEPLPVPYYYLDLPPKMLCRARGLDALHAGRLGADGGSDVVTTNGSVDVYHFPIRSFAQFVTKLRGAAARYARKEAPASAVGWHRERWYRMLVDGDIERAFREALPSERRLLADLRAGVLVVDKTMSDDLERLSRQQRVPRLGGIPATRAGHARSGSEELVKGTAVCILGMHRSGTSAVARLLNLLGVELGPAHRLPNANEGAQGGYLEHPGLSEINMAILDRFGGRWDQPPSLPPGWERSESLADLRESARELLRASFANVALWGWKDPRTCLTLPFWQSLLPPMRYAISLRSPLSVARSLERRNGLSVEHGARLWLYYVTAALRHTEGRARLIVSYERLLATPEAEARRLADFIGCPAGLTPEMRIAIAAAIRPTLSHHRGSLRRTLESAALPFHAQAFYAVLCLSLGELEEETDKDDSASAAVTALARAALKAEEHDLATQQLQENHNLLEAGHRRLQETMLRLSGHPVWRGYLRLRRSTIPPDSRREATLKGAWRWLRARPPGER